MNIRYCSSVYKPLEIKSKINIINHSIHLSLENSSPGNNLSVSFHDLEQLYQRLRSPNFPTSSVHFENIEANRFQRAIKPMKNE